MRALLIVGLLCCVSGCGGVSDRPAVTPVSGSVKFKGVPQEGATVTFSTTGSSRTAVGVCNASGEFKLTTFDTDDGAIAGSHVVTISKKTSVADAPMSTDDYMKKMQSAKGKAAPPSNAGVDALPTKYSNPADSGLKRDVIPGETNVFNFDLTE